MSRQVSKLLKASKSLRWYVNNFLDGDPYDIEAMDLVKISVAEKKADEIEIKDYLKILGDDAVELWKTVNSLQLERCATCGR